MTGGTRLQGAVIEVGGDPSSSAFFVVAALIVPGADVVIGPVTPRFAAGAPAWIQASGLFDKPRQQERIADLQPEPAAATCNALLRADMRRDLAQRIVRRLAAAP